MGTALPLCQMACNELIGGSLDKCENPECHNDKTHEGSYDTRLRSCHDYHPLADVKHVLNCLHHMPRGRACFQIHRSFNERYKIIMFASRSMQISYVQKTARVLFCAQLASRLTPRAGLPQEEAHH
jgi:hypothetical protein